MRADTTERHHLNLSNEKETNNSNKSTSIGGSNAFVIGILSAPTFQIAKGFYIAIQFTKIYTLKVLRVDHSSDHFVGGSAYAVFNPFRGWIWNYLHFSSFNEWDG